MRLLPCVLVPAVAAITVVSANAALARGYNGAMVNMVVPETHNYSGHWPVTVTDSNDNFTGCLTLAASGSASLTIGSQKYPYGSFQIFNNTLVATIQAQGYGQNAGLVFIGKANRAQIGPGVFDEVYGGEAFEEGALAFGMKGGC